eukprot:514598_1
MGACCGAPADPQDREVQRDLDKISYHGIQLHDWIDVVTAINQVVDNNDIENNDDLENKYENDIDAPLNISWAHVINCMNHEMYPKLSAAIRSIIYDNKHKIDPHDLDEKHSNKIIDILNTKRHLLFDERNYLEKLIHRARSFVSVKCTYENHQNYPDPSSNSALIQDIFDVHRHFLFSNYHFQEYTPQQLDKDISKIDNAPGFLKYHVQIDTQSSFYPSYIIDDDMFLIMEYLFMTTKYVNYLRNNLISTAQEHQLFKVNVMVLPQSVVCVYDNDITFNNNIDSIDNIDDYLHTHGKHDYLRVDAQKYILQNDLQYLYDIDDIKHNDVKEIMIVIDRRHLYSTKDILYLFTCKNVDNFIAVYRNYFVGFDFWVDTMNNNVYAYLRYGLQEKSRFYPEMLVCFFPRLFKRSEDINEAKFLDRLYSHKYKHGWIVDLNDTKFNKYYKMVTSFDHVSVNYNREFSQADYYSSAVHVLCFRDLLEQEICMQINSSNIHILS